MAEVVTWNALDAFGDPERAHRAVDFILSREADVVMIPEAYAEDKELTDEVQIALETFRAEGYTTKSRLYDDNDGRGDRHGWIALGRTVRTASTISLGSRTASHMVFEDPEDGVFCDAFGVHFDDRAEATRRLQVQRLLDDNGGSVFPSIIFGDHNVLHREQPRARAIRSMRPLARALPTVEPQVYHEATGMHKKLLIPARLGSVATRMIQMADGGSLHLLEEAGYKDADPDQRATFSARRPLLQLDRIMHRDFETVGSGVVLHDPEGLSDHLAVSATLRVASV